MKAVILAAGYGTRIKKNAVKLNKVITDTLSRKDISSLEKENFFDIIDAKSVHEKLHGPLKGMTLGEVLDILDNVLSYPKPLLKVNGKVLLDYLIDKIKEIEDIDQVFIITNAEYNHYYRKWAKGYDQGYLKIINNGKENYEEQKRREAVGDTVFAVNTLEELGCKDDFLLLAGDSYYGNINFVDSYNFFKEKKKTCLAYHKVTDKEDLSKFGTVSIDKDTDKVRIFIEKPSPKIIKRYPNLYAAPIFYFIPKDKLEDIPEFFNLENNGVKNILERLQLHWEIYGTEIENKRWDIGSLSVYIRLIKKLKGDI